MLKHLTWETLGYYRWTGADNLGDQPLNDYLVDRWFPRLPRLLPAQPRAVLMCSGSILGFRQWMPTAYANVPWLILGTGFQYGRLDVPENSVLFALRGPRTHELLTKTYPNLRWHGSEPVYGDPGILLPKYLPRTVERQLGKEATIWKWNWPGREIETEFTSRTGGNLAAWMAKLWSCERIITDSLHAALISDAYGIPWRPLRWEQKWADAFNPLGISAQPRDFCLSERMLLQERQTALANAAFTLAQFIETI